VKDRTGQQLAYVYFEGPTFCKVVSLDYLRPLGRPTRKYLKATRPSPAGNRASQFTQRILPCTTSQASTVTNLYSAPQLGQLKGIGSDWLIVKKEQGRCFRRLDYELRRKRNITPIASRHAIKTPMAM
jgi:hypothetical protein